MGCTFHSFKSLQCLFVFSVPPVHVVHNHVKPKQQEATIICSLFFASALTRRNVFQAKTVRGSNRVDKHIQGKREGCDYYNNSSARQHEWGSQQTFFPQLWVCGCTVICVSGRGLGKEMQEVLFTFQGAGAMQSCVTGYSIYGRKIFFFFSQSSLHPN